MKRNIHILIVDDSSEFRQLMNEYISLALEDFNIEFFEASNGVEAVEINNHNVLDYIFIDINMPEMDGITAATMIDSKLNRNVKIIAVSSNEDMEHIGKMIMAGAKDYLVKTKVNNDKILNLFKKHGVIV